MHSTHVIIYSHLFHRYFFSALRFNGSKPSSERIETEKFLLKVFIMDNLHCLIIGREQKCIHDEEETKIFVKSELKNLNFM